jgi:hypothetical protein
MNRPLPYPDYKWSFTQHAEGFKPKTLYNLLSAAAQFEGLKSDSNLDSLIIELGVLTPNERKGKFSPWRDYQQILAELGLIFSTTSTPSRQIMLTELGRMYLSGEIGFSELISVQALKYQYPNGQKFKFIQVHINNQILIKPGVLILRVLVELLQRGLLPKLEVSECQAFLTPCRSNSEWVLALEEIMLFRNGSASPQSLDSIHHDTRRNIQDWFKLLSFSDYFDADKNSIKLSRYAIDNIELMKEICAYEENLLNFWIPQSSASEERLKWFAWFGFLTFQNQKFLRKEIVEADYLRRNYVVGINESEDVQSEQVEIRLSPLNLEYLARNSPVRVNTDLTELVKNIQEGIEKRHAKTLLHDRIIKKLATTFIAQGAKVFSDPDSIDLFTEWSEEDSAIFEVKTVTSRSFQGRLRTAIGQIEEYAYRKMSDQLVHSDKVIVINALIGV